MLGFAELHTALPTIVGDRVEDEHHNRNNGDAPQRTTGGLLVWRKADNWTAFTDGSVTWINGPLGLEQRQNTQRFQWEPNPDRFEIVPPLQTANAVGRPGWRVSAGRVDAGTGNFYQPFEFTNMTGVVCVMHGFPVPNCVTPEAILCQPMCIGAAGSSTTILPRVPSAWRRADRLSSRCTGNRCRLVTSQLSGGRSAWRDSPG